METRKIIICRGIQGSGKSTWAKQWCHEDPEHRVRFNNDDIRNMLGDYWIPSREKLVKCLYDRFLLDSMARKYDIVIDNMNLNPKTVAEIESEVDLFNRGVRGEYGSMKQSLKISGLLLKNVSVEMRLDQILQEQRLLKTHGDAIETLSFTRILWQ